MPKLAPQVRVFVLLAGTIAVRAQAEDATTQADYTTFTPDAKGQRVLRYRVETDRGSTASPARNPGDAAAEAVEAGVLSPYTLSPRVESGRSWARAVGGFDSAAGTVRARSSAESALTGYLALRVDFEHGPSTGANDRVSVGGRLQVLKQKDHGIDGGIGLFYQPNDFRGEGNIVGGLLLGRRFGRLGLFASGLIGSDPEGDDQELDGRLGAMVRVAPMVQVGWDNRFRSVLSTDGKRNGSTTTDWDFSALPTAILTLGPLAVVGEGGFSALKQTVAVGQPDQRTSVRTGVIVMAGAGAAF